MKKMQNIILLGRKIRENKQISVKTPLNKTVIVDSNEKLAT